MAKYAGAGVDSAGTPKDASDSAAEITGW
jgi:hypothetical protein